MSRAIGELLLHFLFLNRKNYWFKHGVINTAAEKNIWTRAKVSVQNSVLLSLQLVKKNILECGDKNSFKLAHMSNEKLPATYYHS